MEKDNLALSRGTVLSTRLNVCPAKRQISRCICVDWSVFAVRLKIILGYTQSALRRHCSVSADAQADLIFRWAHMRSSRKSCALARVFRNHQDSLWSPVQNTWLANSHWLILYDILTNIIECPDFWLDTDSSLHITCSWRKVSLP